MPRRFALVLTLLASAAFADESLVLERPADVSEADWKATLEAFRSSRGPLAKALVEAAARLPAPGADPVKAFRARYAMRRVLGEADKALVDALVPAQAAALNDAGVEALVAPRLSGRVVRVGEGGEFRTFFEAIPSLKPGDTVHLLAGDHLAVEDERHRCPDFPDDVVIEGEGRDKTSFRTFVNSAKRVRFQHLTLLGSEDEIFSLNNLCLVHLRDCMIREFNSRKGDSTALHIETGLVLVEDCEFRGLDAAPEVGEDERIGCGGIGIIAGEDAIVVVRRTKFVDCDSAVILQGSGSLDDCSGEKTVESSLVVATMPDSRVYFRNCRGLYTDESPGLFPTEVFGSDAGRTGSAEALTSLFRWLDVERNLTFCLGLTRHADPAVREAAKKRWSKMTLGAAEPPAAPPMPSAAEIDGAFRALDSEDASARDKAADVLRAAGEAVRARLKDAASAGSVELRGRAASLLAGLDRQAAFGAELEFAKRASWLDENAETLRWNEEKQGYEPKP